MLTESMLGDLRTALHDLEYLAERQAGSPTDATICQHLLRRLRRVETEMLAPPPETGAGPARVEERGSMRRSLNAALAGRRSS